MKYQKGLWTSSLDISIRDEVTKTLEGTNTEFGRGRWFLLRRLLRDSNDRPIDCAKCKKKAYHTPIVNAVCDACFGVGYIWEEQWVIGYKWSGMSRASGRADFKKHVEAGFYEYNNNVIYLKYDTHPRIGDKIIEVSVTEDGQVITPFIREMSWDITAIDEHFLDQGRIEYWRLTINRESLKYFGQPLPYLEPSGGDLPR